MCDKLVFDLAQEVEGTPNVFVRKDWINILDNQNQNYSNNQSIIDTSQLSNSNKYMGYRESYLLVPMTMTLGVVDQAFNSTAPANVAAVKPFNPTMANTSVDYSVGLKSWFGNIIHSMTLDYNGTTIIQQTPYSSMWNSFKLVTSLSLGDIVTQGPTIGFYPDDSFSFGFYPSGAGTAAGVAPVGVAGDSLSGDGVCFNTDFTKTSELISSFNSFDALTGNDPFLARQKWINYDSYGIVGAGGPTMGAAITPATLLFDPGLTTAAMFLEGSTSAQYVSLMSETSVNNLWKSYISNRYASTATALSAASGAGTGGFQGGIVTFGVKGFIQYSIVATIYLKHLHSFFNMCPLLKGVFMKLTLNLNNSSSTIVASASAAAGVAGGLTVANSSGLHVQSTSNALGGILPLMVASAQGRNGGAYLCPVGIPGVAVGTVTAAAGTVNSRYIANISVGATCLDQTLVSGNPGLRPALGGSKSVYLYVPAYTFNPVFEQAYLSSPVKQIKYTDIYQYQVIAVGGGGVFNNLITNGIANIKSILILPFYSSTSNAAATVSLITGISTTSNTGLPAGMPVFQSPFDTAGTGTTSPLSLISNFNVQISGQNAIYNLEKYGFEQFNNQLYGQNAVNGGLTDGLTSGLIGRQDFDMSYCYYYVNVERMLPVEMSVPKSVQILGTNMSAKAMDYYVFVEYGVEISIDSLTGARV
jgi:hypothetical protein